VQTELEANQHESNLTMYGFELIFFHNNTTPLLRSFLHYFKKLPLVFSRISSW
jgi:hypothetical protein